MSTLSSDFPVGKIPLNEYPRPQLARAHWQNLNGLWGCTITTPVPPPPPPPEPEPAPAPEPVPKHAARPAGKAPRISDLAGGEGGGAARRRRRGAAAEEPAPAPEETPAAEEAAEQEEDPRAARRRRRAERNLPEAERRRRSAAPAPVEEAAPDASAPDAAPAAPIPGPAAAAARPGTPGPSAPAAEKPAEEDTFKFSPPAAPGQNPDPASRPVPYLAPGQLPTRFPDTILVPFAPESALSGLRRPLLPRQTLWYRRTFFIDGYTPGNHTLLHFGAVDYACTVYLNGHRIGGHTGGYCPFTMNVTSCTRSGENELIVEVTDETDRSDAPRGKQKLEPGGIWYTAVSGIWQTVWLEHLDPAHINAVHYETELDRVRIWVEASSLGDVQVEVLSHGRTVVGCTMQVGDTEELVIPAPRPWSPEDPYLYTVRLRLVCFDHITDEAVSYFGLRTFAVKPGPGGVPRFYLNGKPYFQKGLLDQGYWPDGLYTAPSDEALRWDIEQAKALGFNMLRKHMKVEPARWYYHCDQVGMLVWQDMPSGGAYIGNLKAVVLPNLGIHLRDSHYATFLRASEEGRRQFLVELQEMIESLRDAVCIATWVPFNEGWGQFDAAVTAALIKKWDPSRPVDHASGWHDQGAGDYNSIHKYILKVRPAHRDGRRAFALTEYGGYSQAVPGHCWDEDKSFGYRMLPDKAALTEAYYKLHEEQILPLLDKGLCVTIYTQLTDVEQEVNGLFTYDRKVCKLDEATVRAVNKLMTFETE